MQRVTPVTHDDSLLVTGRRLVSIAEEPVVFMTRYELGAILIKVKVKVKALVSSIYLHLKPPYYQGYSKAISSGICYCIISEIHCSLP